MDAVEVAATAVDRLGFAILAPPCLDSSILDALARDTADLRPQRNILAGVAGEVAGSADLLRLVEPILGKGCQPVRGIFFNKTPLSNWLVPWHQDLTICVEKRLEAPGYGPWTLKAGIPHVQPPIRVLEHLLAVRIHLDHASVANGGLRVLPGTHRLGRLSGEQIEQIQSEVTPVACDVEAGGVLLMRPLLLHASSAAFAPANRRVIHLEYANYSLDYGLQWRNWRRL